MPQAAHFVPPPACAAAHKDANSKNKRRAVILLLRLSRYSSRSSYAIYEAPMTMLKGESLMQHVLCQRLFVGCVLFEISFILLLLLLIELY